MKKGNISFDAEKGIYRIGETAINEDALYIMGAYNEDGERYAAIIQSRLLDMIADQDFESDKDQHMVLNFIGIINQNAKLMRALYQSAHPGIEPFEQKP